MGLRTAYEQTEIHVFPTEWAVHTLGLICDVRDGTHESPRFLSDGVPFVTSKNIVNGRLDFANVSYISQGDAVEFDKRSKVDRNDILLSMIGTIGSAALVDCERRFCIKNVALLKCRKVAPTFLIQLVHSPIFQRYLAKKLDGGIQKFISLGALRELSVTLPQEAEQRAIATALSDVDALLDGLERLIAKKRDLKQAAMQQLLTGHTRLPGFHGEWEVKRLGDHVRFLKNGTNSRAELTGDGSVKYLHYGDIHVSRQVRLDVSTASMSSLPKELSQRLDRVEDGDVAFVDASEDLTGVGKAVELTGVANNEVVAGLHTIAARFDKTILADGFKAWLQFCPAFREHLLRLAAGTKVYATTRAHIASVEMLLPSVREQTAIAAVLADMDAEFSALEARRSKTRDIKQAMMQELLTGRIRLV